MKLQRTLVVSVLFVLVAIGVGVWLYPHLPVEVATHWNGQGQADGWSARFWAVALWPLLIAGITVLKVVLPRISPRKFKIKPFAGVYGIWMLVMQAFVLVVGVCALLKGAGYRVPLSLIITLATGVLFMVFGNYMGKLRKNFFIGLRTPWTLASSAVWERTHRLGGWLFMLAGIAWVITGLTVAPQRSMPWLVAAVLAAALIAYAYSYFIYRRLLAQRKLEGEGE